MECADVNKVILFILFIIINGCGSYVTVNPRGCYTDGEWKGFLEQDFVYERQFHNISAEELSKKYQFFIKERIWTPFGNFAAEKVYLKNILRKYNIECADILHYSLSFKNNFMDMFSSFFPFLGSKTIWIYGNFFSKNDKRQ